MRQRHALYRFFIIVFWIVFWQIASLLIDNHILFVGPVDVARALLALIPTYSFWSSIAVSFTKITLGFLSAFLSGILIGSLSYRFRLLRDFLEPIILLMKSVPVASFVILALIWVGSRNLAMFSSFLVVFPVIYVNTIAGLSSTSPQLLEMAKVFSIRPVKQVYYIYLPALLPYLASSCQVALGMCWKSSIAAEVIGVPTGTIGEHLYTAKIYLNTANLFAWTIVIIAASAIFEKVCLKLIERFVKRRSAA